MTEIFFIAFQFPPLNIGGSFRPLKFVKYFNDFNIKPIIFTLDPDDYPKVYGDHYKNDINLLEEIKDVNKEIIHVSSQDLIGKRKNKIKKFIQIYFNTSRGIEHRKWEKSLMSSVTEALKNHNPKLILVTAPPFGIIDLAIKISEQTKLPLIIDLRDSLSTWISQPFSSYLHYKIALHKEKRWFKKASKILTVTNQIIEDWKSVHKNLPSEKCAVIANGFDMLLSLEPMIVKSAKKSFIIGYSGTFYYDKNSRNLIFTPWYKKRLHRAFQYVPRKEDWLYRSPYFLFQTLNVLFQNFPEYKEVIKVQIVGDKTGWLEEMINEFNLQANVKEMGRLSYNDTMKFQNNCDMLLLTSVKVLNGKDYCIAGKSFDYLSSGKPVLAFVSEGEQKEFIKNSGSGILCNPDDTENNVQIIKDVIENGVQLKYNETYLKDFHRRELTKKLATVIKVVIENPKSA